MLKKRLIRKIMLIFNVRGDMRLFNQDSRSHPFSDRIIFCCSSCRANPRHYFNRGWLQRMPGTSHIEVASHPSRQEIRNFNGGIYTMKRISKSMFRGAIAQPTSFKLCRMVQTYMLCMEPQGMMAIADTQSHTHSRFVCTDTKLVDVVIFFPLISNVL